MFSKKSKLESFIGANTEFEGDITMHGTLRLDGKVRGNIKTDWLIVGDKGSLKGDVAAGGVVVGGTIEGNIAAKDIVEIKHKGRVAGDVSTIRLAVVEGGVIEGRISMHKENSNIIELKQEKIK